jgi:probable F420-dependent oxidoreductase
MTYTLGGTGIWNAGLRFGDRSERAESAAEVEELGYTAVWVPDVGGDDLFDTLKALLSATNRITVATGILNLWMHDPAEAGRQYTAATAEHGRRLLMGIGVSHAPLVEQAGVGAYRKPLARMQEFLDGLDAAPSPVPAEDRVLAALGPKMLELARGRSAGAHPYLVTPEHTSVAREALGPDKLLAPEQGAVLESDPARARAIARAALSVYFGLPNYVNNWKRYGFTDEDVAEPGSDRLVDALVVWGDEATIAARVQEHRDAGADHVCVQVLTDDPAGVAAFPREEWRRLASALV